MLREHANKEFEHGVVNKPKLKPKYEGQLELKLLSKEKTIARKLITSHDNAHH